MRHRERHTLNGIHIHAVVIGARFFILREILAIVGRRAAAAVACKMLFVEVVVPDCLDKKSTFLRCFRCLGFFPLNQKKKDQ